MLDRVPFEIFQKIIKLSLDTYSSQFTDFGSDGVGLRPPIKMSHVCRAWRTTLLSDPTLWACLNVPRMKVDQLEEFLRRSGSVPLSVFLSFTYAITSDLTTQWYGNLPTALALVLKEMRRIQVLEFIVVNNPYRSMENVLRMILRYLKQPAPMLQTLYVAAECWTENAGALQTLFSGHAPNLENIHYQVIADFEELSFSPLLQNLSSLYLHLWPSVNIDRDFFLDVLELSPCLRVFELVSFESFGLDPDMVCSSRRVHLPCLQLLTLRGMYSTDAANFILEHLTFPFESTRYSIEWRPDLPLRKSDSASLIQFLAQRRHTSLSLSVSTYSKRFKIDLDLFESYPYKTERSTFMTTYDSGYQPVDEFPRFLRTFRLSHIVQLHLTGAPLKTNVLENVLILLVNLKHLVVEHNRSAHSPPTSSPPISFLLALMPQWSSLQERPAGLGQKTKNKLYFQQNITELDNNTGNFILPCLSLSTLNIKFFSGNRPKLDELYAQAIETCCSVRRRAGRPFANISIYRLRESLTQEAESILLRNEDCPIDILMTSRK